VVLCRQRGLRGGEGRGLPARAQQQEERQEEVFQLQSQPQELSFPQQDQPSHLARLPAGEGQQEEQVHWQPQQQQEPLQLQAHLQQDRMKVKQEPSYIAAPQDGSSTLSAGCSAGSNAGSKQGNRGRPRKVKGQTAGDGSTVGNSPAKRVKKKSKRGMLWFPATHVLSNAAEGVLELLQESEPDPWQSFEELQVGCEWGEGGVSVDFFLYVCASACMCMCACARVCICICVVSVL